MKPLSRRTVLRGAGACLALPFLDAMRPAREATAAVAPPQILWFFFPNGVDTTAWRPSGNDTSPLLSVPLLGLEPVRDRVRILSGLQNQTALSFDDEQHQHATGRVLTCTGWPADAYGRNGVSIDQRLAARAPTALRSLELGSESMPFCIVPWCAGASHISWSDPTTPLPVEVSPSLVFQRLFGVGSSTRSEAEWRALRARRQSVLDRVLGDATTLKQRLGNADRGTLDAYLTAVRELERQLNAPESSCEVGSWDAPPPIDIPEHVAQMSELMALALACDRTRLITYMLGNARSERSFSFLGLDLPHHRLSHHTGAQEASDFGKVIAWIVGRWAALVERLQQLPGPRGSLLDEVLTVCFSGMGESLAHQMSDLPVLIAGSPDWVTGGVHQVEEGRPLADLWLTLARTWDVQDATFGDEGSAPITLT
jgi:hypothetical protein